MVEMAQGEYKEEEEKSARDGAPQNKLRRSRQRGLRRMGLWRHGSEGGNGKWAQRLQAGPIGAWDVSAEFGNKEAIVSSEERWRQN